MEIRMRSTRGPLRFAAFAAIAMLSTALKTAIGMNGAYTADTGTGSSKSIKSNGRIFTLFLLSFVGHLNNLWMLVQLDNAPTALAHLQRERGGAFKGLGVVAYDFPGV
jgi:hypothetical protein